MGLPIAAQLAISVLGPAVLNEVMGGNKQSEQFLGQGRRLSDAEASLLEDQLRRSRELEDLIKGAASGGAPPVYNLDLRNPVNIEEFFGGVRPMADINLLMKLLGQSPGPTGLGLETSRLGLQQQGREDDLLAGLVQALLMADFGGGGGQREVKD